MIYLLNRLIHRYCDTLNIMEVYFMELLVEICHFPILSAVANIISVLTG